MNLEQARFNMVEQQVRCWDVFDQALLDVLHALPRENFAPTRYEQVAYADMQLPLGHGQVMLPPVLEGRLLQSVQLQPTDTVLEIGTGSGYLTACIAALAKSVLSVDIFPEFIDRAHKNLSGAMYKEQALNERIELRQADVFENFDPGRTFDVIVVTGAVERVPAQFVQWMSSDARMFIIVGTAPNMQAQLLRRRGGNPYSVEGLLETDVPFLVRDRAPKPFQF
ncbi:MAG: protein-L-isoaspartate O-methyltransferase [Gammaproteobacteria bacterium]|jgi:protein-L-isoaspartate(D-aspartate) O-methyltransferase|nr:protein-L-isoaspartate O-methyltransferase [Gammaproteobacteria bacterium]